MDTHSKLGYMTLHIYLCGTYNPHVLCFLLLHGGLKGVQPRVLVHLFIWRKRRHALSLALALHYLRLRAVIVLVIVVGALRHGTDVIWRC